MNSNGVYIMACEPLLFQYYNHVNDCSVQFMKDTKRPETAVLQKCSYNYPFKSR